VIHYHFDTEPREPVSYSPHTRTLSDYPLLIGEVLRRSDVRRERRAKRVMFAQRIKHFFGGH
jgi:hypothetical protein